MPLQSSKRVVTIAYIRNNMEWNSKNLNVFYFNYTVNTCSVPNRRNVTKE